MDVKWPAHGDFQVSIQFKDFVSRFLATNARMGVAVATHAEIYGARLFAARFLAPNVRMAGVGALAIHAEIYGAILLVAKLSAA